MTIFFKNRTKRKQQAEKLYQAILIQARSDVFYEFYGVPDTMTGRFESLCLHAFMVWYRFEQEGKKGEQISQAIFDAMFRDMNYMLREQGVGDLSVPRNVKKMMQAYKGRALAYKKALLSSNDRQIEGALQRNLFGVLEKPDINNILFFKHYLQRSVDSLTSQDFTDLCEGRIEWIPIPKPTGTENIKDEDDGIRMVS